MTQISTFQPPRSVSRGKRKSKPKPVSLRARIAFMVLTSAALWALIGFGLYKLFT